MAAITKEEKARREAINAATKTDIHRALDRACAEFGSVKAYKKGGHDKRAVEEALASWVPCVVATTSADGKITLAVGPSQGDKPRKAKR